MKKIAVIGANLPLEPFYRQAKALGYYIIGIAYEKGAVCKQYCDKFYPISFVDKDKVLETCRNEEIDGITSFSLESALPTVVYVAQNLGLVSNTEECVRRLANKYTMRNSLNAAGIRNPQYAVVANPSEPDRLHIPFPCIVKPVDSGGSQGVTMVTHDEELKQAYERSLEYSRSGKVIIEQFIDGREFSVEYLSCNGKHYNIQITDKVTSGPPYFIELQHHQPAKISSELRNRICTIVEKALTALCVENSPSHTEIKLNSNNELFIIETGARMGGGYITSDLVRLSTGYDMVKGTLDLATGDFIPPFFKSKCFSGIYFYSSLTPDVKRFIDNAKDYPFIVDATCFKEEVDECKCNADRNGYCIYQSDHKIEINHVVH